MNQFRDRMLYRNTNTFKDAFNKYFSGLLKRSIIEGVPQLANTKGIKRALNIFTFIILLLGFIYQAFEFVNLYLGYPVTLTMKIETPDKVMMPAITICTGNRYE